MRGRIKKGDWGGGDGKEEEIRGSGDVGNKKGMRNNRG
jgi:hypothetical protein